MSELLDVFNENYEWQGTAEREAVHVEGLWHQTFHCWILTRHNMKNYVLVQRRSAKKKVAPNKLDISAAGHLIAGETKEDGIREVKEELGISNYSYKLIDLGIRISSSGIPGKKCNREFCNVVFLEDDTPLIEHNLQEEEVSALIEINVEDGLKLFSKEVNEISVVALLSRGGEKTTEQIIITRDDFIKRIDQYYFKVFIMADRYFKGEKYLSI